MNDVRILLAEPTVNLFESGTIVNTVQNRYLFFPFWLKDNKDGTYTMYDLDNLPEELQEEIKKIRK